MHHLIQDLNVRQRLNRIRYLNHRQFITKPANLLGEQDPIDKKLRKTGRSLQGNHLASEFRLVELLRTKRFLLRN